MVIGGMLFKMAVLSAGKAVVRYFGNTEQNASLSTFAQSLSPSVSSDFPDKIIQEKVKELWFARTACG